MVSAVTKFGQDVLDFIVELDRIPTIDQAMNALSGVFKGFGFETLVLTGLPNPAQTVEQVLLAKRVPNEWFKIYIANQYVRDDPVPRYCRMTVDPFEWSNIPQSAQTAPRAREVMRRAADFGLVQGLTVPIHGISGYEACVSLAGEHPEFDKRSKAASHLIAIYAFNRIRQLLGPVAPSPSLTPREREVLAWSVQGKSAWEIGEILSISQRTVEEHRARIYEKLGAMNHAHAVAIALRDRLIEP